MPKKRNPSPWKKRSKYLLVFIFSIFTMVLFHSLSEQTATNAFCESCHVHPQATITWKQGPHYDTESGMITNCVDCHLPAPSGFDYYAAKVSTGARDVYGKLFKDANKIDWEAKRTRDYAITHVYESACLNCHQNLFPKGLSQKGMDAHFHYEQKAADLHCLNCHIDVGHFRPERSKTDDFTNAAPVSDTIYSAATAVSEFASFRETIPGTSVDFEMIAIPGGNFTIGSPANEAYRNTDEGPQRNVQISQFWMGKIEVSWDEYMAFYSETATEGRSGDQLKAMSEKGVKVITGPTPPYGNPDQGWGRGKRPAITMTHYAAQRYCEWLSEKTGKKYRLPTEAEWEYACRANSSSAYFFPGAPDDFIDGGFFSSFSEEKMAVFDRHIIHKGNSKSKTALPEAIQPNAFGLLNMNGNVREFCSDYYVADAYAAYPENSFITNPGGPKSGEAYVVRGGSYKSEPAELRSAKRDFTREKAWLQTDPQVPKSLWWYSDCTDVGFRVVCEY